MADLITHTCAAVLFKCATKGPYPATFIAGTCLPDLLGRVPAMGLSVVRWKLTWIPEPLIYLWNPLHMPVGIALGSALVSLLFPAKDRKNSFYALLGGGMLHLAVDLLQRHFGVGYLLFFPFSLWDFELGWISSEATVLLVPVLLPLTLLAVWWRKPFGGAPNLPVAAGTPVSTRESE